MKKSFLISATVAATMLFSCSSEETASVPSINESDLTPVVLGLSSNSTDVYQTRGTGTVGDTAQSKNLYHNEDLYVLMTTIPSVGGEWKYTTVDAKDNPTPGLGEQFNNTFKARPSSAADGNGFWGINYIPFAGMNRYYPIDGSRSDFFVYHIDDAAVDSTNVDEDPVGPNGVFNKLPKVVDGETPETKVVKFEIDGSQDLLAGKAEKRGDDAVADPNRGYSAKTARAGIIPQITMKHLLTRFTFSVQSGDANAKGLIINAIKVYSKTKGNLIVAYNKAEVLEPSDLIEWEEQEAVALALQQRQDLDQDGEADIEDGDGEKTKYEPLTPFEMTENTTIKNGVGEAIFVAPNETEYAIEIDYKYPYGIDDEGETIYYDVTDNAQKIKLGGSAFLPGSSYHVNIIVYGMSNIELQTELEQWVDGGVIDIDTSELYQ